MFLLLFWYIGVYLTLTREKREYKEKRHFVVNLIQKKQDNSAV